MRPVVVCATCLARRGSGRSPAAVWADTFIVIRFSVAHIGGHLLTVAVSAARDRTGRLAKPLKSSIS